MTDLSIIIPAYYEAAAIGDIVRRVQAVLATLPYSSEILVIDDGSQDDTAVVAQAAGATIISHPYNIGNGAAVKTGIRHAQGNILLMMDGDGQHPPEDIPRLLAHIDRFDMIVGARTSTSDSAWYRNVANAVYNRLASYVSGRKIEDLTSGFRVIKGSVAREFVYLLPNTFSYPTTITLAVLRSGYSLKYEPIVSPRRIGTSKIKLLSDGARFLTIILRITVFFAPLKVFLPISLFTFLLGFGYGAFKVLVLGTSYGPTSANLMVTAVLIFLIGLVSEQISYLRYGRQQ